MAYLHFFPCPQVNLWLELVPHLHSLNEVTQLIPTTTKVSTEPSLYIPLLLNLNSVIPHCSNLDFETEPGNMSKKLQNAMLGLLVLSNSSVPFELLLVFVNMLMC